MEHISIEGCKIIGKGGMSVVYKISDALAVKVFRRGITYIDVLHEYDMSHSAFALGMPTPRPYSIVEVGMQYGIVYELLRGDTLSSAISEHPERLEDYATQLSSLYRKLHSTTIKPTDGIPNAHRDEESAIRRITPIFGPEAADKLLAIHHSIPQGSSLLHCDLHPRNVMLHNGEMMIIDMGEVGYGNPILEMSHVHALMTSGLVDVQQFMGFPGRYAMPFWDIVLSNYYSDLSETERTLLIERLDVTCLIRCFTWLAVSDGLPQEVITRFKGHFEEHVNKHWDIIKTKL